MKKIKILIILGPWPVPSQPPQGLEAPPRPGASSRAWSLPRGLEPGASPMQSLVAPPGPGGCPRAWDSPQGLGLPQDLGLPQGLEVNPNN